MAILPLSVQLEDKIELPRRERTSNHVQEAQDASTILEKVDQAAALQAQLGFGNPTEAVQRKKKEFSAKTKLLQAEKLAQKFVAVKEPQVQFFPRFDVPENSWNRVPNAASATIKGSLPRMVMSKLGPNISKVYVTVVTSSGNKNYEAPIPVMPLSALELAKRAKELAPDAAFHLLFMPSWEEAPQRDPVLVAHIPGTDEWFEIAAWDGDKDLIKEFLEEKE